MSALTEPSFLASLLAASIIFFFAAAGVVLVLWIAMPFSLFGLKGKLKGITETQQETNRLLKSLLNLMTEQDERQRRSASALGAGVFESKDPKEPLQ